MRSMVTGIVLAALVSLGGGMAADVTLATDSDPGKAGELRYAIDNADGSGAITFDPDVGVIDVTGGAINVADANLILSGNVAITSSGTRNTPILSSANGAGNGLTLDSLTFRGIAAGFSGSELFGGGIVGARHDSGNALLGNITADFLGNTVETALASYADSIINGGGLAGAYSFRNMAAVGNIDGRFLSNTVKTAYMISGGGLVGANASDNSGGTTKIGTVAGTFGSAGAGNTVITRSLFGGGLVGAFGSLTTEIGNIDASFTGNTVTASTVGSFAGGGLAGAYAGINTAAIAAVSGAFTSNTVTIGNGGGGGLVGAHSNSGAATIGAVSGTFVGNTVTVGGYLDGAGVIAAFSEYAPDTARIGNISNATFTGNTIAAGAAALPGQGYVYGGVIANFSPDAGGWKISDTVIKGNSLAVANHNAAVTGGTVFVGTNRSASNVTVSGNTEISGNTIRYNGDAAINNSFHFGRERSGGTMLDSLANASLTLDPGAGKTVSLLDPVSVDMNNGKAFAWTVAGSGRTELGGRSRIDAAGGSTFATSSAPGATLFLAKDFSLGKGAGVNGGTLNVELKAGGTLILEIAGRNEPLALFADPDAFDVTGGVLNVKLGLGASFDPDREGIAGKWLVTDNPDDVTDLDFSLDPATGAGFGFLIDRDGSLYIAGSIGVVNVAGGGGEGGIPPVIDIGNPNVASAYYSSALEDAWLAAQQELGLSPAERYRLFNRIGENPQKFTAEPYASQAVAALSSADAVARAVRNFSGLGAPGGRQRDAAASTSALASRVAASRRRPVFWGGAFGSGSNRDGDSGLSGFDVRRHGAAAGFTAAPDAGGAIRAGAFFASGRETADYDRLGAENTADLYQGGVFLELRPSARWGLRFDADVALFKNSILRDTPLGRYSAEYDQRLFSLGVETGYDFRPGDGFTRIAPFAGLRGRSLRQDGVRESAHAGAPRAFAAELNGISDESAAAFFGVEIAREVVSSGGRRLTPSLRAGWTGEFGNSRLLGSGGFALSGTRYNVISVKRTRQKFDIGAGLEGRLHETGAFAVDAGLAVNASFAANRFDCGVQAALGISF